VPVWRKLGVQNEHALARESLTAECLALRSEQSVTVRMRMLPELRARRVALARPKRFELLTF
jgi:hypothetical protein